MTSIIILSYNTLDLLQLCLESIRYHTKKGTYELIVVDNASKDGSLEYLRQQKDVRLIANSENVGFPKGCNQGLEIAKGNDLLLLNSDTIVTPRWLEQLKTVLYSNPKVGAVSCMANSCANFQDIPVPYEIPDLEGLFKFADEYNNIDAKKWIRSLHLVMFCFLFKREVYNKIGGLDEIFTPGNYEDNDYCIRIWKAGYECWLAKDTFIHHFNHYSFQNADKVILEEANRKYEALLTRNEKIFQEKWGFSDGFADCNAIVVNYCHELNDNNKVLVIGCYCGLDIFHLEGLKKKLHIDGIAFNFKEAEICKCAGFNVKYVETKNGFWRWIRSDYDAIFVSGDLLPNSKDIERLINHTTQNGRVYYWLKRNGKFYGQVNYRTEAY